ncbi:alkaline phosphatase family protein [Alloacidobacterium dinghuense]|uniref:Alkaline phosphatase family protein n=1 Tax=Alloacidobacterium dinghuense TaxID=2763107 RepID=A0A7G8BHZ8_9BACT|nr:alkaline phosphatase family protein [Alloacidobacterium dinghuense]QNI32168.1 alkaline phosphatase family protein [Alloacidobacterium dinghuense]
MLKRFFSLALILALTVGLTPRASASAYDAHPKLVVILVIDQFREDYLQRYRADFKPKGLRLFLDHGAYFPDCYYGYSNLFTAPGHSTIGTGAYTDGHGIGSNAWWDLDRNKDRPITSVEDERYAIVGMPQGSETGPGRSPRNLLASTVGDELRLDTKGHARVFGISLKDRAAILPAGASANGAFWVDEATGRFETSTYYMPQLPDWATAFNASGRLDQAKQEANQPNTTNFENEIGSTPASITYELDFAKALVTGEQMGKHDVTDMLTLSISGTDILGHRVGPDADEQQAIVDALDTDLDGFFAWLDKNVEGGLGNVWIAITADHGVAPSPAIAAQLGMNAAQIDTKKLVNELNDAMNQKFSPGEKVVYVLPKQELPFLSLNRPSFERAGINEQEAEQAVQDALEGAFSALMKPSDIKLPAQSKLPPRPVLYRSYTRLQLAAGELPHTQFGDLLAHSYTPNGGWYVRVVPAAFQMGLEKANGTTHFTPYSYDRHVPLGFYGAPFTTGVYHGRVEPVDLAATFASLLGVNQPSASVGRILTQALKPAAEVTYPKAIPARTHRGAHPTAGKNTTPKAPAKSATEKPQP